jgi:hypothetical protein
MMDGESWGAWRCPALDALEEIVAKFEEGRVMLGDADGMDSPSRYEVTVYPLGTEPGLWLDAHGATRRQAVELALDWTTWLVIGQDRFGDDIPSWLLAGLREGQGGQALISRQNTEQTNTLQACENGGVAVGLINALWFAIGSEAADDATPADLAPLLEPLDRRLGELGYRVIYDPEHCR